MSPAKKRSAKQVVTTYFDAIADRDLDAMTAVWKPGSIDHLHGLQKMKAPGELRSYFGNLFDAVPDFRMEVLDMVAYGDKAAVRWRARGTFSGTARFEGLAATGAKLDMEGLDLLTVEDGLITENHAYLNAMEMSRQLGAMPAAGSLGERALLGMVNARTAAGATIQRLRNRRA